MLARCVVNINFQQFRLSYDIFRIGKRTRGRQLFAIPTTAEDVELTYVH